MTLRTTILVFYIVSYLNAEINAHNSSRCDFFDSVDLTNARKLENGSYVFQDILIPAELTFTHVEDQTSIRGCVCEIKPCINFCSPAVGPQESLSWDVKMKDGTVVNKRLEDVFALQRGSTIPCDEYNSLNIVRWELLENGSVAFQNSDKGHTSMSILLKQSYCFELDVDNRTLVARYCQNIESNLYTIVTNCMLLVSIFFLAIALAIYTFLSALQKLFDRCCVCYLACLTVGFIFLSVDKWEVASQESKVRRGQIGYFAVMGAFLWMSVICFDMWKNMTSNGVQALSQNRFRKYSIYAWGSDTFLLVIAILADHFVTDDDWKPNFGLYSGWITTNGWSAVIYYYGPMTLIIVCNIAMFVLTAVELLRQEKFIRNSLGTQLQRALKTKRQTLCTFSKLFVLMGVTWHLEILSYICKTNSITIIGDLINSAQGLYIFVVLVLNKTVLKHLRKRLCPSRIL